MQRAATPAALTDADDRTDRPGPIEPTGLVDLVDLTDLVGPTDLVDLIDGAEPSAMVVCEVRGMVIGVLVLMSTPQRMTVMIAFEMFDQNDATERLFD